MSRAFFLCALLLLATPQAAAAAVPTVDEVKAELEGLRDESEAVIAGKKGKALAKRAKKALKQTQKGGDAAEAGKDGKAAKRYRKARKELAQYHKTLAKLLKKKADEDFGLSQFEDGLLDRALSIIAQLNALVAGDLPAGSALVSRDGGMVTSEDSELTLMVPPKALKKDVTL